MTTPVYPSMLYTGWEELSLPEFERLEIVMETINHYAAIKKTDRDLVISVPGHIHAPLMDAINSGDPTLFTKSLLLQLAIADIPAFPVTEELLNSGVLSLPTDYDGQYLCLSQLFSSIMNIFDTVGSLKQRGYVHLLAQVLAGIVLEESVMEKANLTAQLYVALIELPSLRFNTLYTTIPVSDGVMDIAAMQLRCLAKGYPLPALNLTTTLLHNKKPLRYYDELFNLIMDPKSEDIVPVETLAVIFRDKSNISLDDPLFATEHYTAQERFVFTDMITDIVGRVYESERVAGFALRRFAEIIALLMNASDPGMPCRTADALAWLNMYRERYFRSFTK